MTVAELLGRIDSRELSEWMAYYQLEPFGEQRADIRAAMVCSVLGNIHRDPKKHGPFTIEDFMPFREPEAPKEQTMDAQKQFARQIAAAFGLALK